MKISGQRHSQKGAALLVSLVLLLGLTVVGVAGMKESLTQQKVVNAVAEDDTAFQAAEFALREGERFIRDYSGAGERLMPGKNTYNGVTVDVADERANETDVAAKKDINDIGDKWWKLSQSDKWKRGWEVVNYPSLSTAQKKPAFMIEVLIDTGSVDLSNENNKLFNYRVTAKGYGVNSSYYVILQSTYGVQM